MIVVDDFCPEKSGKLVREFFPSNAVNVIFNSENLGVGGATKAGYLYALDKGAKIIVKLDGDGQMLPEFIADIIRPIVLGTADYVTGNRFSSLSSLLEMPKLRIFGNAILSFMAKASTGFWNLFDPNNGYTAIRADKLKQVPLHKIDNRYFFESDLLFRLNLIGSRLCQIEMHATYGNEKSNLIIKKVIFEFAFKHMRNYVKRICYSYFVRDFNVASINLIFGLLLTSFSLIKGLHAWLTNMATGESTATGTQILVTITFLIGFQLLLSFISMDVSGIVKQSDLNLYRHKAIK